MGVFSDIELEWGGSVYTIRGQRVMGALSRIEDVITLAELQAYSLRGTAPLVKLCMAYGAVLRYAGAKVTDDEVYDTAFAGEAAQGSIMMAIMDLMKMMLPASARARLEAGTDTKAEDREAGNPPLIQVPASSKPRSKRR